ncbi:MAG: hypothetical protein WAN74_07825 [Thermoplasmata archaeon]
MGPEPKRRPIWVRPELLRRVERQKIIPEEPAWKVVERLLDEHDARIDSGRGPTRPSAGKPPRTSILRTFGRSITGRDPHDHPDAASVAALPPAEIAA